MIDYDAKILRAEERLAAIQSGEREPVRCMCGTCSIDARRVNEIYDLQQLVERWKRLKENQK